MMSDPAAPTRALSRAHRLLPMSGRDTAENHRGSTPLELLFDLTFAVAFSVAAGGLTTAVAAGRLGVGLVGSGLAMFATCLAWINFSWFASAFDTDDWVFRVATMVQMMGVLILALGIPPMFASLEHGQHIDNGVMVLGYVVMRIAMVFQWLRAARQSADHRQSCLAYAVSISVAQIGWVVLIFLNVSTLQFFLVAVLLAVVELAGPAVAERREPTPWHAHHIAERYSLLTIIALGEGIVGTTAALSAVIEHGWTWQVALVGLAGTGLVFGMWWCYFTLPSAEILHHFRNAKSFAWGYGHLVIFSSVAATGAGLHVVASYLEKAAAAQGEAGEAPSHHIGATGAVLAVVIPVAIYTMALYVIYTWLVGEVDRFHSWLLCGTAVFLVLSVLLAIGGAAIPVCLLVLMLAPVVTIVGYETVGHAHQAEVIARSLGRETAPA